MMDTQPKQVFGYDFGGIQEHYSTEFFPPKKVKLYHLIDRYAAETSRKVALDIGLLERLEQPVTLEDTLNELGVVAEAKPFARRVVQNLCLFGVGEASEDGVVTMKSRGRLFNLEEISRECLDLEPKMAPAISMLDKIREVGADFCKGKVEDNAVRSKVHINFFTECPMGTDSSMIGGMVVREIIRQTNRPVSVLELGAGTMSGAFGILDLLDRDNLLNRVATYHFSELNPFFVMKARETLHVKYPGVGEFKYHCMNFDRPFSGTGIDPESIDIVYSTNAIHCSKNMLFTLGEIHDCLRAGGCMISSQFSRFEDENLLPMVDLICDPLSSYWDVETDAILRPKHGILSPGRMEILAAEAGFEQTRCFPEESVGRASFEENYFIGAVISKKRG